MFWFLGFVWICVVGRMVLDDATRFELWFNRTRRQIERRNRPRAGWPNHVR